ncbi:cytoplasmic protein [Candidatus Izimaplasma bacterium ZiA1]|uniref:PH domain-containing protein n=1 Tax=Candidatus Izimoplasma sp. ZiA1 TaxID=2024899 RepID=UPI000BAA424A|nr:cytoplasmic protein [Candidatus Izimaplasma bacterium ZiA1]
MIDFQNKSFLKMKEDSNYQKRVVDLIVPGEQILGSYKSVRDGVVFTSMRIIVINVQGLTGKKVDFTSLPYKRINAYSIETAGSFDMDAELDIFISGLGQLRFEFRGRSDIKEISKFISQSIL